MAWHPCRFWQCVENYGGQCFGGGCRLNPAPHYLYDDGVPFADECDNNDNENEEDN